MGIITLSTLAVVLLINCYCGYSRAPNVQNTVTVKKNIVFQKVNEVSTTRAKWLATLVIDFNEFDQFMSKVESDIRIAKSLLDFAWPRDTKNIEGFDALKNTVNGLRQEIEYLSKMEVDIKTSVNHVRSLTQTKRNRRSLLPFVGGALSWLFGTITEADIGQIKSQVSNLAKNQQTIIHAVEQSLTVINESRAMIRENRQSVIDIIGSLDKLNKKIRFVREKTFGSNK